SSVRSHNDDLGGFLSLCRVGGTVLYIASMWVNGITQGLMWRAINDDGTLTYSFVEALQASHPGYIVRALGGAFFASGMLLMAYNVFRTVRAANP
ncbi:hypothetical protein SB757_28440, partial [Pseudomonas sp. SIMBA_065]